MSSREPERPEYERRVLESLRKHFLEDYYLHYHGGRIEFEDVRLEGAGSEDSSVVITFRASDRPGCLYGRRENAVGPLEPWQDPQRDAPEGWADMIWIRLEEDIHIDLRLLPKRYVPETVTWI